MTKYEIMYIIRPTVSEDNRKQLIEELNNVFTSMGSEVTKVDEWGTRDLRHTRSRSTRKATMSCSM